MCSRRDGRHAARMFCRIGVTCLMTVAMPALAFRPDPGAVAILLTEAAIAGNAIAGPPRSEPRLLGVGAGAFDVGQRVDSSAVYGAQYRFGGRWRWNARPLIGVAGSTHHAAYVYGGLHFGLPLTAHLDAGADFALAAYHRGGGKDLGSAKEFYFALGLDYRLQDGLRIELAAHHLSHDDLFSGYDPGVDNVTLGLLFPLGAGK